MEKDPLRTRDDFKGKGVLRTSCPTRLVLAFEFA